MKTPSPADILAQIAQIQLMERGKLCAYSFKERADRTKSYFKLQLWEKGKNVTRYIRSEQVPMVREALVGHAKFQDLVEQYAHLIIEQTREELATVGVKKKPGPRPGFSRRRSRKSKG